MISLVVPIFNEEENLLEFRTRASGALDATGDNWEILFVNDGSRDRSAEMLRQFNVDDARLKTITLSRNFGHQPAVTAGVHHASGDCVVLIDGDLQDPPEVIPQLVQKWKAGAAVVLAVRASRVDTGVRSIGFKLFYPLMRWISDQPLGPDAGIFGLMDRVVVNEFNKLPERNRFIPGLRTWLGFPTDTVTYDRKERAKGKPKQTFRRLIHYAADGMMSFSYRPLRVATWMGMLMALLTFLAGFGYVLAYFLQPVAPPRGFTTIMLSILFLGSVQLICVGILGEYIGRIYEEVKQRPLYVVREKIGMEK